MGTWFAIASPYLFVITERKCACISCACAVVAVSPEQIKGIVIAYEPIWAIGTGKTATTAQAQEMHAHLRSVITSKYGETIANQVPILYGGSVKANNAKELFSCPDVDGGLVGGASLVAADFIEIIRSLK